MKRLRWLNFLVLICAVVLPSGLWAQEEAATEEGAAPASAAPAVIYMPLKPSFVVNYDGGTGRLRYLKADISLRLSDSETARSAQHHMPFIRNNLVMLFAAQNEEMISSQDGKEALRQEALETVRELLKKEDSVEGVVDLFFNGLVVQR